MDPHDELPLVHIAIYIYIYTGWRRINWTVQTFNRVYENLHKITPLTLVAHRLLQVVWYGMA